ncbi:hypothetical protein [Vibrio aquimaris]|jgi:hypothetical protein|uniref:Lipoprotein n=1 Tax=Vibrio aquimaris TaxID=2587862 RepID=A0A5P9CM82_9VIBR|nr:hypothetical protein [Vibrio aquimaris]QFT27418.1 hypothetical protein FIV01_13485 [Vibrio aquimaris]
MTLKHIAVAGLTVFALSACQTTSVENIQTTASQTTIDEARKNFKGAEDFKVLDNGVIYYTKQLDGKHRWSPVHTKELSYRMSCEDFRWYLERGMTVRIALRGKGAVTYDYNLERCETEAPTNLYDS